MNYFKMSFAPILENEVMVRVLITTFLTTLDVSEDELMEVKTIVSEGVCNAIIHGYEFDNKKLVHLTLDYKDNTLLITIEDHGIGIRDIELAKTPMYTSKAEFERSGMGFTIMGSLADSLEIISSINEGTKIIMSKKLHLNNR